MFYLLSLIIFSLKIRIEIIKASIVYILKTIIFLIVILSKLAFITPLIIVTQDSKGKYSHILENTSPNNSLGKYIPLVKQTSWTTILDIPDDAFSENRLPNIIPIAIKRIATTIEISIAQIILMLKLNPKAIASIKNNTF